MKYKVSMNSKSKRKPRVVNSRRPKARRGRKPVVNKVDRFKKFSGGKKGKGIFKNIDKLKFRKFIYISVGVVFFMGCISVLVVGIFLKNLQDSLPSPDQLIDRSSDQSTQIFDRNEELLFTIYGDQNREFIPIDRIPEHTKWALLAAEDIDFYQHKGIDYISIGVAFMQNVLARRVVRGASTLTQQLVKNTILYDVLGEEAYNQTYLRKVKELLITMQVEQSFTKDEILQMYMNEIPLGGVNYGYQAAANAYFAKDVEELTLAESAMIAGIIKNASIYSPLFGTNPELAKGEQEKVLDLMLKYKNYTGVTEEQIEEAKNEELVYSSKKIDIKAPHFVFYVKNELEQEYGKDRVERGGLKVITSLDYNMQEIAEEEVIKGVSNGAKYNVHNGSLVAMDPRSGEVLAMVGSVDYWNTDDPRIDGNVNIATSLRQPGSSAKPYTYLSAIMRGYGPWTLAPDMEMSFGGYKPVNWDKKHFGLMTARQALIQSRNLPAVYTLQIAGIDTLLQTVEKLGITTMSDKADYGLSLALGSGEVKLLEHVGAFSVFATGGVKNEISPILKVETAKGDVLFEKDGDTGNRVFEEKEIYMINYTLCDLGGHGDQSGGSRYRIQGKNTCYKTGTTNGPKDLLTVMYHKNLVVGVWAGNNNNEDMPGGWSSNVPLPLAHAYMLRVSDEYPVELYNRPSGIISTTVCKDTGKIPQEGVDCPKEATIYMQGHAPSTDSREILNICKSNGLVAENYEEANGYELIEQYIFLNNKIENSAHQKTYDAYLSKIKDSKYLSSKPESAICPLPLGPDNAPVVEISSPNNGANIKRGSNITISGNVRYLGSVSTFTVLFDSNPIAGASLNADGTFSLSYTIPSDTSIGAKSISITAIDNRGKSNTKTVSINVIDNISVNLNSPANGVTIAFPVSLSATVNPEASSLQFLISKSGGYSKIISATKSGVNWVGTWNDSSGGNGDYSIKARAIVAGNVYESSSITVSY